MSPGVLINNQIRVLFIKHSSGMMYGWSGDGLSEFILVSAGDVFLWNIMILKFGIKTMNCPRRRIKPIISWMLMIKREIRLEMHVATIFGLVITSIALGNYVMAEIIQLTDLTILPAMHFPALHTRAFTCSYSFNITYAPGMLTLCCPSSTSPLLYPQISPSFQL